MVIVKVLPRIILIAMLALSFTPAVYAEAPVASEVKELVIEARQFAYTPGEVRVARGQRVRILLRAMDVAHGLFVDGYEIKTMAIPGKPSQLEFVANSAGVFRIRCTQTCGTLHPFMVGKLVVDDGTPFSLPPVTAIGILFFFLAYLWIPFGNPAAASSFVSRASTIRRDLLQTPFLGAFLRRRSFQFVSMLPFLVVLTFVLVVSVRGSPVGSHNLGTILTWVVWWPLVIILLIPVGGRLWCTMCPIPGPGEWLQRLAFVRKREGRPFTLGRQWPVRLRNMWLQNAGFLCVAALSALIITMPSVTALVLGTFIGGAIFLSLIFSGRTFCRYVCPLGGFIGLCSMVAPLAVRVKDGAVCQTHAGKECIRGSSAGHGCPWFEYPGTMERNAYCGLCLECAKTCPNNNIAVRLHSPGNDLLVSEGRSDEAFRIFIALGSVAFYTAVMQGPWAWLRMLAVDPLGSGFLVYIAILLSASMIIVPGSFLATASVSRLASAHADITVTKLWQKLSYGLVPLAVMAWISFSLALLLVNGHYILPALSDPLGQGWDLFGTAASIGAPWFTAWLPKLQAAAILVGLGWSLHVTWRLCRQLFSGRDMAIRGFLPVALFSLGISLTLLWLSVG